MVSAVPADDAREELSQLQGQVKAQQLHIEQLNEALQSARTIGKAIGMIMEREKLTSEQALTKLLTLSQHAAVKLRRLAETIVQTRHY